MAISPFCYNSIDFSLACPSTLQFIPHGAVRLTPTYSTLIDQLTSVLTLSPGVQHSSYNGPVYLNISEALSSFPSAWNVILSPSLSARCLLLQSKDQRNSFLYSCTSFSTVSSLLPRPAGNIEVESISSTRKRLEWAAMFSHPVLGKSQFWEGSSWSL